MKVCIVGGGGAGVTAANTIRKLDQKAEITIFTKRKEIGYPPCEIPYLLGRDIPSFEKIIHSKKEDFAKKKIKVLFETTVKKIDLDKKIVFAKGKKYSYDKLVMATGSEPFLPPIKGAKGKKVYQLGTDISSAKKLDKTISHFNSAVIIGAGGIGLEMAIALKKRFYKRVYLIELADRILPSSLDKSMSKTIEKYLEKKGIQLMLSTKIIEIKDLKNKKIVKLADKEICVSFVLFATGSLPRTKLAKESGLTIGKTGGIAVNNYLQTSNPEVFAIGDCMESWEALTGKKTLNMLASNVVRSAKIAAKNIIEKDLISFNGTAYSFAIQVGKFLIACTGYSESYAKKAGLKIASSTHKALTRHIDLGGEPVYIKLVMDKTNRCLVGGQIISQDNIVGGWVDKLVVAISEKISCSRLSLIENLYTPAIDNPYNALTQAIDKLLAEKV